MYFKIHGLFVRKTIDSAGGSKIFSYAQSCHSGKPPSDEGGGKNLSFLTEGLCLSRISSLFDESSAVCLPAAVLSYADKKVPKEPA